MSYYERHVFFCCNQRTNGEACCADKGAQDMRDYAKKRVKELGLAGPGKVRVNQAGCLDRCEEGPCVVVYPEAGHAFMNDTRPAAYRPELARRAWSRMLEFLRRELR